MQNSKSAKECYSGGLNIVG